jgi:hypothetical protein
VKSTPTTVYNFTVKDFHTYFVSNLKIWTHNSCPLGNERRAAVRQAWAQERALVKETGQGTVDWTRAERAQLLSTGKVSGYVGHHINSVSGSPGLAGNPNNIRFVTYTQHFNLHMNNWRNATYGDLLNRQIKR